MSWCTVAFRTAAVLALIGVQSVFGGETIISILPVGTGPGGELAAGAVIDGNVITLTTDRIDPVPVFLEFRIGDWDPDDTGVKLRGYQLAFDSSSFKTGYSGELSFNVISTPCGVCSDTGESCSAVEECTAGTCSGSDEPCYDYIECGGVVSCQGAASCDAIVNADRSCSDNGEPCASTEDCTPGKCPISGLPCHSAPYEFECSPVEPCLGAATCAVRGVCEAELGTEFGCGNSRFFLGNGTCSVAAIDTERSDYVYFGVHTALPALDLGTPDIRVAGVVILGSLDDPEPFPVEGFYAGTIALLVPPDALGTFTISILPFPATTLYDAGSPVEAILPLTLIPAKIRVNLDQVNDCNHNGVDDLLDVLDGSSLDCTGNGVPDECEPDCNANGKADSCDIADGTSVDRLPLPKGNGVPDECPPIPVHRRQRD